MIRPTSYGYLAAVAILSLLGNPSPALAEATPPLIYCSEAAPRSFDPSAFSDTATASSIAFTMFDRLVDYPAGGTDIEPGLASSWRVSDDGLIYAFTLREGVKFHGNSWYTPTRTLTAEDVVFSFRRQLDKSHAWFGENEAGAYGPIADMAENVESIEANGNLEVQFKLKEPFAAFLANMAMAVSSIVSAEYAAAVDARGDRDLFTEEPVGTGPFRFVDYQKDVALRFEAHQDYWKGPAKSSRLVIVPVIDQATRMQKVLADECHIAPYPVPWEITRLKAEGKVTVSEATGLNYAYLAFNTRQVPFDNKRVRLALAMAIDKEALVKGVYDGRAKAADTPVPPGLWSHHPDPKAVRHDPEMAQKILKEEGVEDLTMKLWAMPVQRPYNPNGRRMAELIQSDLAKVGVASEIVTYEWGEYLKRSKDINRDGAVMLGWSADTVDPDNFLAPMFSCKNIGAMNRPQWCSADYDALIEAARLNADPNVRTQYYFKAQEMLADEVPLVPLAYATSAVTLSKRVRGYVQSPTEMQLLHGVYLE